MTPTTFLSMRDILLCMALLCGGSMAVASPTSDEFEICSQMEKASLHACLGQQTSAHNNACQQRARHEEERCRAAVWARYARPDPAYEAARVAAQRKAEAEARAAMEAESMHGRGAAR
ncbi:hypothetical protein LMG19083_02854 [Ralstonia psammae]|uniref:Uncharacterized protein n=1 Tax=Ralstonia psammae TaxID=3058598 RepID=A0ABN9J5Y7_9RALS|nr:hypothetical protein LMG19083_02854 [Ralstonia sp. LMG 19083]